MNTDILSTEVLNASLDASVGTSFSQTLNTEPDVLSQLLADKRSLNTRIAYEKDVKDFFKVMTGKIPTPDVVLEFLHLEQGQAMVVVLKYKAQLIRKGLKEATVNRRMAAIKSLVVTGRKLGVCHYSLEDIESERVQNYRDTSGIDRGTFELILNQCDLTTDKGKRDYAILRLLWGNALRRNEVCQLNVGDFDPETKTLRILGKGRGTQSEVIDLGGGTVAAISQWLECRPGVKDNSALFVAVDFANAGGRLTGDGLRKMLVKLSQKAGIKKQMSPHRIRHSAITAALDATDGNVRKVQKLSRHRKLDTLMIYDDNRHKDQGAITDLLDGMF
ncbi:tyrosine-type recombinase/integrase [Nodularia harveyana UHCC-0300]|uniref:Tyrosine-type recombinase/integrase n=1 Tax=Nodularia harveyana UHCC-0300 TaxID=2974287 RepID=A0ABU5UJT5_9CYAN|nr:tyrosine-type recombinase/integrase [Nodularia harveyana]MEA5583759.1 tyrosine-type recombinase/integrase [Nodularia harveyana UHCC-0300]